MLTNKEKYFLELFHYWCGRLKIPRVIKAIKDNRMSCVCCVEDWESKRDVTLRYNLTQIEKYRKPEIIIVVFHEIGHFFDKSKYRNEKEQIESEHYAENFAIKMIRKYYKSDYKLYCRYIKSKKLMNKLNKTAPLYYKAFLTIKEYKESLK